MRTLLLVVAATVGGLTAPTAADAYWGSGAGIGIGGLYRSLDYPTERRVPYFAAHPPVYYSQPVPRTFGYSPFAYTPDTRTPDVVPMASAPVTIANPYVRSSNSAPAATAPAKRKTKSRTISATDEQEPAATGPLMIINPYVTQSKTI